MQIRPLRHDLANLPPSRAEQARLHAFESDIISDVRMPNVYAVWFHVCVLCALLIGGDTYTLTSLEVHDLVLILTDFGQLNDVDYMIGRAVSLSFSPNLTSLSGRRLLGKLPLPLEAVRRLTLLMALLIDGELCSLALLRRSFPLNECSPSQFLPMGATCGKAIP
jgi:hypothetical protein